MLDGSQSIGWVPAGGVLTLVAAVADASGFMPLDAM
jgi:hypothetical protein